MIQKNAMRPINSNKNKLNNKISQLFNLKSNTHKERKRSWHIFPKSNFANRNSLIHFYCCTCAPPIIVYHVSLLFFFFSVIEYCKEIYIYIYIYI